jgi:hypothetical protein
VSESKGTRMDAVHIRTGFKVSLGVGNWAGDPDLALNFDFFTGLPWQRSTTKVVPPSRELRRTTCHSFPPLWTAAPIRRYRHTAC